MYELFLVERQAVGDAGEGLHSALDLLFTEAGHEELLYPADQRAPACQEDGGDFPLSQAGVVKEQVHGFGYLFQVRKDETVQLRLCNSFTDGNIRFIELDTRGIPLRQLYLRILDTLKKRVPQVSFDEGYKPPDRFAVTRRWKRRSCWSRNPIRSDRA